MQLITPDSRVDDALIGGKAAGLRRLADSGYPIPDWFVVPADAHATGALDVAARRALIDAATDLADGGLLAVRSSARDEDGAEHSFAGQFETMLAVPPEAVPDAVERVWASAHSDAATRYRREHDLGEPVLPAVLVQRQLDPEAAGVAFSVDPVVGNWREARVSAVPGCGTALVNGEVDGDDWSVDAQPRVVRRQVSHKSIRHALCTASEHGVRAVAVPETQASRPTLTDTQVIEVAEMSRRVARLRGAPQDVEFAFSEGRLHLLQSRPITTLGQAPDRSGALALWDNSNIAESYGGITSPMTYSFARHAYEHVYRQFCALLGVDERTLNAHRHVFGAMIGLIRGRVVYNLLNWHRLLALLPGYQLNRGFMEQMMGVDEALGSSLDRAVQPRPASRLAEVARLARTGFGLMGSFFRIDRSVKRFQARLDDTLAAPGVPLADQRIDELAAHYRELESRLLTRWDAPLENDLLAMIFFGATRSLAGRWLGDGNGTLQNDLVGGEGGVISAEPAARVRDLAALVRGDDEWVDRLANASAETVLRALPGHPALEAGVQAYLARFGDRCLDELKLESASLVDDPEPLFRAVAAFAKRPQTKVVDHAAKARADAEATVRSRLRNPVKRAVFGWFLKHARARVKTRENLRFERTRLFGRVRRIVVEMGRRLAACRELAAAEDVFYLQMDELLGFIEGTTVSTDLKSLVALRRKAWADYAEGPAPADRFRTHGAVHIGNPFTADTTDCAAPEGDVQGGTGACPGVVRGPARVVRDPKGVTLEPGTVLVAERTDPGWIMLFPAAAGLVVERGSLLSHSAIVARELGLPTVVGVARATDWIEDGDIVELDGTTGAVRKVEEI